MKCSAAKHAAITVTFPALAKLYESQRQNDYSQRDPVVAKDLEIVLADEAKQEANDEKRHDEGDNHPNDENGCFVAGKVLAEAQKPQKTGARHHGYGEQKSELGGGASGHPQKKRAQNGRPRARGAGEDGGDQLEDSDEGGGVESDFRDGVYLRGLVFVHRFDDDEENAKGDEGDSHA